MNRTLSMVGAATVTVTVFLFALCMLLPFLFGSYFVSARRAKARSFRVSASQSTTQ